MGVILGIIQVILGFLAMSAPLYAGVVVIFVVGFFAIAGGVVQMVFAFKAPSFGRGVLRFLLGGLMLLGGLAIEAHPLMGLATMTLMLAMYFIADGITRVVLAFDLRPEQGWSWLVVGGLVSLVLGILLWRQWPLSGAWAVGVLVGVNLMISGWQLIILGPVLEKAAQELAAETVPGASTPGGTAPAEPGAG
ncbi:MAG: DUF308 domain-containing protein [Deltaproteobacteria bacterium]|nr:DUF308 domain-containing protein [Deltaproteobacteria bacterium]